MSDAGRSWFDAGFGGLKREEERQTAVFQPRRFYLKPEEKQTLVFLDDLPVALYEHNPNINGTWQNWLTCLTGSYDEVACCDTLGEKTRYYVGYFTVLNFREWTNKQGVMSSHELQFYPAKYMTLQKLRSEKEDRGSLVGACFNVRRTSSKAPNCGDHLSFQQMVSLDEMFKLATYRGRKISEVFAQGASNGQMLARLKKTFQLTIEAGKILPRLAPFNYFELLKPQDPRDVKAFLRGYKPAGVQDEEAPVQTENIPF